MGELYTSLQQGVVDAAENNTPSFYLSKHYEVCKYYIVDEHNMIPDVILSSTNLWNNLTINERKWLQEAVNLSVPFQRELWIKSEEESMRAIINSGVEIIYPDKDLFKKASLTMYDKLKKDTEINDLIARIKDEKLRIKIDLFIEKVLVLLLSAMVLNVLYQIFTRYFTSNPSSFTDELSRFLMIWLGVLGAAYVSGKKKHVSINLLQSKLGYQFKKNIEIFVSIILIIFSFNVLVLGGFNLVYITFVLDQYSPSLNLSMSIVYSVIPLSGILIIFYEMCNNLK